MIQMLDAFNSGFSTGDGGEVVTRITTPTMRTARIGNYVAPLSSHSVD
jgi:hypothetical protein